MGWRITHVRAAISLNKDRALVVLFIATLMGFCLWTAAAPDKASSEVENRRLAQVPALSVRTLVSGRFMGEFEDYVSDQFPLRETLTEAVNVAGFVAGQRDNGKVYFGKDGQLFQIENIDFKQADKNIGYINKFFDELSRDYPQVKFSVLAAPSSWNVEKELLPDLSPVPDEETLLARIRAGLTEGVAFCDPSVSLARAFATGGYVYYRTDHHWTSEGAYLAYRDWARATGRQAREKDSFRASAVAEDFFGTGDSKGRLPWTRADSITAYFDDAQDAAEVRVGDTALAVVAHGADEDGETAGSGKVMGDGNRELGKVYGLYDYDRLSGKDKYAFFWGGNYAVTAIRTGTPNGQTLLVIKDSYANCFVPFLCGHFENIILVDLRYYKDGLGEFFSAFQVDEALALYGAGQLANDRNLFYMRMGGG